MLSTANKLAKGPTALNLSFPALLLPRPHPSLASPVQFPSTQLSHSFELCLRPVATAVFYFPTYLFFSLLFLLFVVLLRIRHVEQSVRTSNHQPGRRRRCCQTRPGSASSCLYRVRDDEASAGCVTCHSDVWIVRGLLSVPVLSFSTSGFSTLLDSVCP